MSDEEPKKIDPELKKELLKKTSEDGYHTVEDAAAKLEGKIPTKIDTDLKKELLEKVDTDGYHDPEEIKRKLEGKIPTEKKEE
jgi:hypothetical protein